MIPAQCPQKPIAYSSYSLFTQFTQWVPTPPCHVLSNCLLWQRSFLHTSLSHSSSTVDYLYPGDHPRHERLGLDSSESRLQNWGPSHLFPQLASFSESPDSEAGSDASDYLIFSILLRQVSVGPSSGCGAGGSLTRCPQRFGWSAPEEAANGLIFSYSLILTAE